MSAPSAASVLAKVQSPANQSATAKSVTALVASATRKSKLAQLAMDQLVNPITAPLTRLQPGGGQATTVKSALCRLPIRVHLDMAKILTSATGVNSPFQGVGDEAVEVWSVTSSTDKYFQIVLTDDPVVPLIYPVFTEKTAQEKKYSLYEWIAGTQDLDGVITVMRNNGVPTPNVPFEIPLGGNSWVRDDGDYGRDHPFGCNQDGTYYFWIDANTTNYATVTLSGRFLFGQGISVTEVRVVASILSGSTDSGAGRFVVVEEGPSQTPASGATYVGAMQIPYSGYYSFKLVGLASFPAASPPNNSQMVTFDPSPTTSYEYSVSVISRHHLNYNLFNVGLGGSISDVRVLGSAALCSNITPQIYKGGSVVAFSASALSQFWFSRITSITQIEEMDEAFYKREMWEKGVYGYIKPRKYGQILGVKHQRGRLSSFNGDFADPWGWSCIMLQPSLSTNATLPLQIQQYTALEFWTENPMFMLLPSEMSVDAYNLFLEAAVRLGAPFSCNPNHFQLIWEAIRTAARTAGATLMPMFEGGVKFTRALQSDAPFSSALATLGV